MGGSEVYVAVSEVAVVESGARALEEAFRDRIHLVERAAGFIDIEVLRDRRHEGRYLMVSRWASKANFTDYMKSEDHRLSHARIRTGPEGPAPAGFSDYDRIEI
ncbi:MAG TPA: antibiotic biosynthesis monooxygenase [Candidatus Dormibacteraeota bacterium]|nr:antibiotic biosynthesis monooxygenase [Candidatus Dormibacteraeota bacterium]